MDLHWEQCITNVPARHLFSLSVFKDYIYLFGGFGIRHSEQHKTKPNPEHLNELWKFSSGLWQQITPKRSSSFWPSPRFAHSSVVYDDVMYIFGGLNRKGENMDELLSYDFPTSTWKQIKYAKPNFPIASAGHTATVYKSTM